MIRIYDEASGAVYGTITEAQLQALMGQLEEESLEDTDYYINQATVDMLADKKVDPELVAFLRKALGEREDMDIRWARE
jgi:hypothetical protein